MFLSLPLWQKFIFAFVLAVPLCQLYTVAGFYLGDEALRYERIAIAALALLSLLRQLPRQNLTLGQPGAWIIMLPAQSVLACALTVAPSKSLAIYAYLVYWGGVAYWLGGSALLKRCAPPLAALAVMVFLPGPLLGPLGAGLLAALVAASKFLIGFLFSDVPMAGTIVYIKQRPVEFLFGCCGYDFMVTYVATCLVFWAGGDHMSKLLKEIALAMLLAFALNLARIITMVALGRAGYWELALGAGHMWLGGVFIFAGAVVVMHRASAAAAVTPQDLLAPLILAAAGNTLAIAPSTSLASKSTTSWVSSVEKRKGIRAMG